MILLLKLFENHCDRWSSMVNKWFVIQPGHPWEWKAHRLDGKQTLS